MSYGGDVRESHKQVGFYTGKVLEGEKPEMFFASIAKPKVPK